MKINWILIVGLIIIVVLVLFTRKKSTAKPDTNGKPLVRPTEELKGRPLSNRTGEFGIGRKGGAWIENGKYYKYAFTSVACIAAPCPDIKIPKEISEQEYNRLKELAKRI